MTLSEQLAPVLTLAKRKGVTDLVPGWIKTGLTNNYIAEDAANLLITGSLSAWLAEQGCSVYMNRNREWFYDQSDGDLIHLPDATDHLSALLAAATARLGEMPDAAGADSATAKEGE